jgi:hypothetical protein
VQNAGPLAQLRELFALNERLKEQETQFKASCRAQVADLRGRIAAIQQEQCVRRSPLALLGLTARRRDARAAEQLGVLKAALAADLDKLAAVKQLLARKTRVRRRGGGWGRVAERWLCRRLRCCSGASTTCRRAQS